MAKINRKAVRGLEGHPLEKKVAKAFTAAAFRFGNGREFIGLSGSRGLKATPKGWVVFNTGWTWSTPSVLVKEAERVGIDAETFYNLFCQARSRGRE